MAITIRDEPKRAIDKILRNGEAIFGRTRVHWLVFVPILVRLAILGAILSALWSGAFLGPNSFFVRNDMALRAAYFVLVLVVIGWNGVKYWTTELAVTNQRIIYMRRELAGHRIEEIPLGEVADTRVSYSGLQRQLGGGRVHVYSSQSGGIKTAPVYRPADFEATATVQLKKVSGPSRLMPGGR